PAAVGVACIALAVIERDPRKTAKKPLAMTTRAKRIYGIALAVIAVLGIVAALAGELVPVWIVAVQLVPLTLVGANLMLAPFEARVQRLYWHEAHEELLRLGPTVIG